MVKNDLTDREQKIVELVKQGLTHEQVAEEMSEPGRNLCERMIRSHLATIALKLGFTSRPQLETFLRHDEEKAKS